MKLKKLMRMILPCLTGIFLFMGLAAVLINVYMIRSTSKYIVEKGDAIVPKPDCIIVLGAGVRADGSPSAMLEDRIKMAVELYEGGAAPKIIMSGDHGQESYDEVSVMKSYAVKRGVPSEDIFMDHAGFSTYETMYRAKEVFGVERAIVVTQKYHMYRAVYAAHRLDIDAYGVAADYRKYYGQGYRDAREAAARVKDFMTGIFKPKPTFLGEAIPVSGNGDVTN